MDFAGTISLVLIVCLFVFCLVVCFISLCTFSSFTVCALLFAEIYESTVEKGLNSE